MAVSRDYYRLGFAKDKAGEVKEIVVKKGELETSWEKILKPEDVLEWRFYQSKDRSDKYFLEAVNATLDGIFSFSESLNRSFSSSEGASLGKRLAYVIVVFSLGEIGSKIQKILESAKPLLGEEKVFTTLSSKGLDILAFNAELLSISSLLAEAKREL